MTDGASAERMPRADSLTGLRWWAAFGVFVYHMTNFAALPNTLLISYGFYGVTFFFVLSGFVLTWSWSPSVSRSTFYWRRFARIYPASLVALLIAIPVFYSSSPNPAQWWVHSYSPVLILSFVLLQGWSRNAAVLFSGNPAAWTLTCEMFFYACHPFIQRCLRRASRRAALIAASGVILLAFGYRILAISNPTAWWAGDMPWPIVRITEFALGMCLAWAMRQGWRPRISPWVGYAVIAVIVGGLAWRSEIVGPPYGRLSNYILGASNEFIMVGCAIVIVLVAARDLRGERSWLRSRPLVMLGEWSYSFYLVHATVVYVFLEIFSKRPAAWSNILWGIAVFAVALLLSGLLHLCVEKPVERRLRRWWDARTGARAVAVG